MKDGHTHLAYKAENTVDLDTDIIVGADVYHGDRGDTDTLSESVVHTQETLINCEVEESIEEIVADKGYHSAKSLRDLEVLGLRSYIPEPDRNYDRRWTDKLEGQKEAVYSNRRRVRGKRSKRLQRKRSEPVERSFAHVCETGGGRRTWLRGLVAVTKCYLIQVAARNLGSIMRELFGVGTARSLQGSLNGTDGLKNALQSLLRLAERRIDRIASIRRIGLAISSTLPSAA